MHLRPAITTDAEALANLHIEGWKNYRGLLPDAFLDDPTRPAGARDRWRSQLSIPGQIETWVAEVEGVVVGFTSFGPCVDDLGFDPALSGADEIIDLWVTPRLRSQGIGSSLLVHATSACARPIVVWVLRGNDRAVTLYHRHGFRPHHIARTQHLTDHGGVDIVDDLLVVR